jgi:hypothetical protein
MTSSFALTLDTQVEVSALINGGAVQTDSETVLLSVLTDPDVIEAKVWGDLEPTSPTNVNFGQTEGDAPWIPIEDLFTVVLYGSLGLKSLAVKVRDDVWNEATATATITLGHPLPAVAPAQQLPRPSEPGEVRTISGRSRVRLRDHTSTTSRRTYGLTIHSGDRWSCDATTAGRSRLATATRRGIAASNSWGQSLRMGDAERILRTSVGPETAAILDLLDLL